MQITVSGKQVETGDALKAHVYDGLENVARKYFDHALEAHVTFRRNKSFFACDINMQAGRGLFMRAEGEAADAHRAFEVAAEHLGKRLRRYRRRVNEHARSTAERERPEVGIQYVLQQEQEAAELPPEVALDGAEAPAAADGGANGHAAPDHGADHGAIIAETPTEIAVLSVGEAVMHMDLADMPVLMFRNRLSGVFNVVYRRPDGHVGWIDPSAR
ncbi:ribosome-associated translation inhibitor RaiA [Roseomonas sp. NAR14]|uniref:Ribosome hibernation promoting factor n=1 Tax=Roseomonas acroporae TaxID=2937791 RepID=A0A9X2BW61_9PROT|nr:ribosome-associated translation inhibitor RaiA [Roseomonas acroporae]MCK8784694.1 ribosome-associated translation inhibitor RaiA [Roseomonas acroporae]